MSARALWLLGRGFGFQVVVAVIAGLVWAVAAPTVGAKRVRGGDVVPLQPGEVRHLFEAFAWLVGVELVAGAAAALVVWLISKPVRGVWLIGATLAGAGLGGFLAVEVGGAVRSLIYPGPGQGPGSISQAAVRLSESEVDVAALACALGAAVALFLAASAAPAYGSFVGAGRFEDRELVGDSQLAVREPVHSGGPSAGFDAAAGGDEHASAAEHSGEVRGVH
ncbi:hypothetical protein HMPREF9336_04278 [Segniliparus rugosus ATCC BAA-974]|uniref:DUF2567 domain-containing protein n=1 Tax=Segniliparus rugosus (strain ATCC BAA-974 / DSM 45345 / CCUG 50838 / CIP 108380 / JCM 13579 / CDC 945) TaxID=679197 RepID=U1N4I5_SEGRC|nr:hypothetical protein HMPREF9336_04278 [Segniliparus rugosus ATCC BAA-974]